MSAERRDGASAGVEAEAMAAAYLEANGLSIVARNVRSRYGEIDLVAREHDTIVFVEVRLRRSERFGGASASITAAKRDRLIAAAESYLAKLPRIPPCRIDALLLDSLDASRIEWVRDIAGR